MIAVRCWCALEVSTSQKSTYIGTLCRKTLQHFKYRQCEDMRNLVIAWANGQLHILQACSHMKGCLLFHNANNMAYEHCNFYDLSCEYCARVSHSHCICHPSSKSFHIHNRIQYKNVLIFLEAFECAIVSCKIILFFLGLYVTNTRRLKTYETSVFADDEGRDEASCRYCR